MKKELSESLLAACKAAGIEKPICIVQGHSGAVYHTPYISKPTDAFNGIGIMKLTRINHHPYATDWQESLLEWVGKPSAAWDDFVTGVEQHTGAIASCTADSKPQGEPLADVLAQHGDLVGDDTEMVILYNVADTSKMIDDACEIAYHKHIENGNGFRWSRAGDYRKGWQDALAWKGGGDD